MNNKSIRVSRKREVSECLFSSNSKKISSDSLTIRITGSAALDLHTYHVEDLMEVFTKI